MVKRMTEQEFIQFERTWKLIFTFFALGLAGSIGAFHFELVEGVEVLWCVLTGAVSFLVLSTRQDSCRDPVRHEAVLNGLDAIGDD